VTATWTSQDLAIRVEVPETGGCIVFSADHGTSWHGMTAEDARSLARGLCHAAEKLDEAETERERSAA